MYRFQLLFLTCVIGWILYPATTPPTPSPKREMRGAWVATVLNIDYPRQPTLDARSLQRQYLQLLDGLRAAGINTLFFQVRPSSDAFYPSRFAPWSRYLTGSEGQPPLPAFDPLDFMIKEAHDRGMTFHAWLNPYRAAMSLDTATLSEDHLFFRHRDWVVAYGDRLYLDPGLPAVREHLLDVVEELVTNYPLDGIHFDDYFYPYPVPGVPFPDSVSFRRYGAERFADPADWRRDNVNQLVRDIAGTIKRIRPATYFGISPFGVWRNQAQDPRGSATRTGTSSYDGLYGDVLTWTRNGWVDYTLPQLYWSIGYPAADYETLLDWWRSNQGTVPLLVGHAAYKVGNNPDTTWNDPAEIPRQIERARQTPGVLGNVYFSAKPLLANPLGLRDSLAARYRRPALWPEISGPGSAADLPTPETLRVRRRKGKNWLRWHLPEGWPQRAEAYYFSIYRFPAGTPPDFSTADYLIHVTPPGLGCERYEFYDTPPDARGKYDYYLRAVDRWHREGVGVIF